MTKKFSSRVLFLLMAVMISFAIFSGGCGGSGGSVITDTGNNGGDNGGGNEENNYSFTNKAVMLGSMSSERTQEISGSNLYSYIDSLIMSYDNFNIESLNNGDIIFIADASELINNISETTRDQIKTAYYDTGVVIAAIYPDSADLKAMEDFFALNLGRPVSFDGTPLPNSHYEFVALGWRQITDDGGSNTFIYAGDHKSNLEELYGLNEEFVSGDIIIRRIDYASDKDYALAVLNLFDLTDSEIQEFTKIFDELAVEYFENYVINLFEWAAELDQDAEKLKEEFIADVAQIKAKISAENQRREDEIEGFASGVTTKWYDPINSEFCNYYREFGINANNSSFKEFIRRNGFSSYERLLKYWSVDGSRNKTDGTPIYVKHETNALFRVINLHSFQNDMDYYIIKTDSSTKPINLEICAPKGDKTRDELEGGDPGLSYHYDLIFGGNRGLSTRVWPSLSEVSLEKHLPNKTANKETRVTDTKEWSIGGGVTVGVEVGKNAPVPGLNITGKLGASFNWGISHMTTKAWGVNDYEIVPDIRYENGRRVAQWNLKCTWPEFDKSKEEWTMSSAFRRSVSFETESIWSVPNSKRNEVKFYGQNLAVLGFCWAHDMPAQSIKSYNAEVTHNGSVQELKFTLPPLLGVGNVTTTGGRAAKMYTARILAETDWKAEVDSDSRIWLSVVDTSGGQTGKDGADFSYRVTDNNTGRARVGNIIITAGDYVAKITFTQSPYDN